MMLPTFDVLVPQGALAAVVGWEGIAVLVVLVAGALALAIGTAAELRARDGGGRRPVTSVRRLPARAAA